MSIVTSKRPVVHIPEDIPYSAFVLGGAKKFPDKTAIIDDGTGEQITYGSLLEKISNLSRALYKRGLRKGDVVCLFADKSITGTIALYAIMGLGAVITPSRPSHTPRELAKQVVDSETKVIIADAKLIQTALSATESAPCVKKVYSIGHVDGHETLDDMLKYADKDEEAPDVKINPKEDTAVIIYSSGTTGLPKGVILTHYAMVAGTAMMREAFGYDREEVFFQSAPPFHIAGLVAMSSYLLGAHQMVLYDPPSIKSLLIKAKQYKVRNLDCAPNFLTDMSKLSDEEIRSTGLEFSDRIFATGGAVFNAANTNELLSRTGAKAVVQVYGSTETGGVVAFDTEDHFVPGSAGQLASNMEMKIIDLNSGKMLGPNERGEICFRGPCVTKGYLNNPEATRKAFDSDGWYHMGDLGYYDENEQIFIVDRLKDVIKYKTMQVAPAEIEEVIYTHPAVKTVCVVGIDDDSAGEVPLACVIVKDGHTVTEQEIIQLVEENLADYKRLRGGVKFMKEFPLTGYGKIVRRELADMAKADQKKKNK